jgi:hypothetical protein
MVKRVNISFREKTLNDLKELVPPRERSKLVNEAVEEKLSFLRRKNALERLEKYIKATPENERPFAFLKTREDIIAWARAIRGSWGKREKKGMERYLQEFK